ncbi:MAG: RloB domain-containing protein [Spirulina sp. SIO3F2]|nr:RloB domain-containing protein [Spirulina sp. SIO3F2]
MSRGRIRGKRTKLLARESDRRDARLFIIATEGAKTEPQYFSMFGSPRVKIEILPTLHGDSAPKHVLARLKAFDKKYALEKDDMRWLVFDIDRTKDDQLSNVCREARQCDYGLAVSRPCFEVWLWLHFADLQPELKNPQDFEQALKEQLEGYNKSNLNISLFQTRIRDAIARAKTLHPDPQQNWPPTVGSHVYRVVEVILDSLKQYTGEFTDKPATE